MAVFYERSLDCNTQNLLRWHLAHSPQAVYCALRAAERPGQFQIIKGKIMSGYVVVHATPKDADKMQEYSGPAGESVAKHGGEFVPHLAGVLSLEFPLAMAPAAG